MKPRRGGTIAWLCRPFGASILLDRVPRASALGDSPTPLRGENHSLLTHFSRERQKSEFGPNAEPEPPAEPNPGVHVQVSRFERVQPGGPPARLLPQQQ